MAGQVYSSPDLSEPAFQFGLNVLAQYVDNDEDGVVDDPKMVPGGRSQAPAPSRSVVLPVCSATFDM